MQLLSTSKFSLLRQCFSNQMLTHYGGCGVFVGGSCGVRGAGCGGRRVGGRRHCGSYTT